MCQFNQALLWYRSVAGNSDYFALWMALTQSMDASPHIRNSCSGSGHIGAVPRVCEAV